MKITTSNYEVLYIDYIDGVLDADTQEALRAFALLHPELELDMGEPALPQLHAAEMQYVGKESLKRIDDEEWAVIAASEGITPLSTPSAEQTNMLGQYQRSTLSPDTMLVYPDKEALKQDTGGIVIPLWVQRVAVAASVLTAVLLLLPSNNESTYDARTATVEIEIDAKLPVPRLLTTPKLAYQDDMEAAAKSISTPEQESIGSVPASSTLQEIDGGFPQDIPNSPLASSDEPSTESQEVELAPTPSPLISQTIKEDASGLEEEIQDESIAQEEGLSPSDNEPEGEIALINMAATDELAAVSKGQNRSISTALDLLKEVTAGSETFALQDAASGAAYTEASVKIRGFEFVLKRKKKRS